MDPISVGITAAVFVTGWLIGRHARLKAQPTPPQPICLCGHHYGTHGSDTGGCHSQKKIDRYSSAKGSWEEMVTCPCVRYTGPQPVEQYWVPPAADMHIVTAPRPIERGE